MVRSAASDVDFEAISDGESRERVNFRVPRELWNAIKRYETVEKDRAKTENWPVVPTRTDILVSLLESGLQTRLAILRTRSNPDKPIDP